MFLRPASVFDIAEVLDLRLLVAIAPAAYALLDGAIFLSRWVLARFGVKRGCWSLDHFLSLPEAENIVHGHEPEGHPRAKTSCSQPAPPSRALLTVIAILGVITWSAFATYQLGLEHATADAYLILELLLRVLSWVYGIFRAAQYGARTPPWSLFGLYVVLLASSVTFLSSAAYGYYIHHVQYTHPSIFVHLLELLLVATALTTILQIPVASPRRGIHIEEETRIAPEDRATLFQWIMYTWMNPLMQLGSRSNYVLQESDVWNLSPTMRSKAVFVKFSSLQILGSSKVPAVVRRLWMANRRDILVDFSLTLLGIGLEFLRPLCLKFILDELSAPDMEGESGRIHRANAMVYSALELVIALLKAQIDGQHLWCARRASNRIRTELLASIYDKALKQRDLAGVASKKDGEGGNATQGSKKGRQGSEKGADTSNAKTDMGLITNLMENDAGKVAGTMSNMYQLYGAPFSIIFASVFLYQLLGWSAFVGFTVLAVGWPINNYATRRTKAIQKSLSSSRDKRMDVAGELFRAIKFVKFFAWEDLWTQKVLRARKDELMWIAKLRLNTILLSAIWSSGPIIVSVLAFFVYVAQGNELTIGTAFTALSLFDMLRVPLNIIPSWIVQVIQAGVSVKRIDAFLSDGEGVVEGTTGHVIDSTRSEVLSIEDGTFQWAPRTSSPRSPDTAEPEDAPMADVTRSTFQLRNISVVFPPRKLTLVTGPTASGKTALLLALLGEMTTLKGSTAHCKDPEHVNEYGLTCAISYSAQTSWLQYKTIRENILFGSKLDEERYQQVLDACSLRLDLEMLQHGDNTEIGPRGVTLSGGQKARVALARAVYASTAFVLLDDPLSAVDSHTARTLLDKLFRGPLLQNRTVVLVTHHVDLMLPAADYVIHLKNGTIDVQGTPNELAEQGILEHIVQEEVAVAKSQTPTAEAIPDKSDVKEAEAEPKISKTLTEAEHRETSGVRWKVYKTYLSAASWWTWVIIAFFVIAKHSLDVGRKLWMKVWGEAFTYSPSSHWPPAHEHPMFYIVIFAAISFGTAIVQVVAVLVRFTGALRASRVLFERLLDQVVHATMRWHDITPQGRIWNRFSKDMTTIDTSVGSSVQSVLFAFSHLLVLIATVIGILPPFILPASLLGVCYYYLSVRFLRTSRHLRRMESNSRSFIFANFGEMPDGVVTVRAFGAQQRFFDELHSQVDVNMKLWYYYCMSTRSLLLHFETLGAIGVFITTLIAIFGYVDAGLAGVCITSAVSFNVSIYWASRFWTSLELDLNAVERIVEYTELPQEAPAIVDGHRPPAYWPSSAGGNENSLLVVENLTVRYAPELPAVLQDVTFSLRSNERVGVVGRTGSGKSTLAMSLLRFVEPDAGRIMIDGIDIGDIGLYDLRSRITFIPQDAALFTGSVRDNLDPLGEHEDAECLDALYKVQLLTPPSSEASSSTETQDDTRAVSITLDTPVTRGGANFSQGQRQLLAIARALLRRSAIVILDEATSSIDFDTDAKIQTAIREGFQSALLLTVAHRLDTIIDYDRVIVLDKGAVAEFDTPRNLIEREGGQFREMCIKSGHFEELLERAK